MRRLLIIAPALLALAGCGGSSKQAATTASAASVPTTAPTAGGCKTVARPTPRTGIDQKPPKSALDPAKTYDVVVQTNCGAFTIRLDVKALAEDDRIVRLARAQRFLRQDDLPPDRARAS